ncbi:hypothetical protein LIER_14925 [Lithospermum erythrorhizon]|uniref:Reverse transcriptase zinc-binding domain-containing protein n=1 Tax=Lithospermum erythrorhizon TaxID=34254 RepID=A0AAV3Q1B0_LITER
MRSLYDLRDTLVAAYGGRADAIDGLAGCCVGGKLFSKLVYEKLRTALVKRPWMSAIWKGFIPPKYSFVVWLACRDRLAVKTRLHFLNLEDTSCVFSRSSPESRQHLFFSCPFTVQFGRASKIGLAFGGTCPLLTIR